jgi:colicin import membrane protein
VVSPVDMEWLEEPDAERARRHQRTLMLSVVAHLFFFSLFYNASFDPSMMPYDVLTVDLVASVPMPAAPKPATPIEPQPETKGAAKPAPAPPAAKVKILPKTAPAATARAARPEPETVRRRPRPEEMSYDDALAQLRNQLGESTPVETPPEVTRAEPQATASERSTEGIRVSPEVAAWILAVKRRVRSVWITPPEFRDARLATALDVDVSATGDVIGEPEVVRSSGNHFYDDNAVRAILKSSPLPDPPSAGRKRIIFRPQE